MDGYAWELNSPEAVVWHEDPRSSLWLHTCRGRTTGLLESHGREGRIHPLQCSQCRQCPIRSHTVDHEILQCICQEMERWTWRAGQFQQLYGGICVKGCNRACRHLEFRQGGFRVGKDGCHGRIWKAQIWPKEPPGYSKHGSKGRGRRHHSAMAGR